MRVIVCGGRDFTNRELLFSKLDELLDRSIIESLISGRQRGADKLGEEWAKARGVRIEGYEAEWSRYGKKAAGPIRNRRMLIEGRPDLVIAFPTGGPGTANMMSMARQAGVKVLEIYDDILVRIEAPHFVAGLIINGDTCTKAAPILNWVIGKSRDELRSYFARKGWTARVIQ